MKNTHTKTAHAVDVSFPRGRPRISSTGERVKSVCICLPPELIPVFRDLGGSKWLRKVLEKEQFHADK